MPPPITTISYGSFTQEPPSSRENGRDGVEARASPARVTLGRIERDDSLCRAASERMRRYGMPADLDDRLCPEAGCRALLAVAPWSLGPRVRRLVDLAGARHPDPARDDDRVGPCRDQRRRGVRLPLARARRLCRHRRERAERRQARLELELRLPPVRRWNADRS